MSVAGVQTGSHTYAHVAWCSSDALVVPPPGCVAHSRLQGQEQRSSLLWVFIVMPIGPH